jgi:hypothetical protein
MLRKGPIPKEQVEKRITPASLPCIPLPAKKQKKIVFLAHLYDQPFPPSCRRYFILVGVPLPLGLQDPTGPPKLQSLYWGDLLGLEPVTVLVCSVTWRDSTALNAKVWRCEVR